MAKNSAAPPTHRAARRRGIALCGSFLLLAASSNGLADDFNGHSSERTGTQGVVGNPNCPPPVVTDVNGDRIVPNNWSCDSSNYWPTHAPHIPEPTGPIHPGPAYDTSPSNPCVGRNGYNWLQNPIGVPLPPGCVRPPIRNTGNVVLRKRDSNYSIIHHKLSPPPVAPPGVEPDSELENDAQQQPCDSGGASAQQAENYRRPDMPAEGQIGIPPGGFGPPVQSTRPPEMPKGEIAPTPDPNFQSTRKDLVPAGWLSNPLDPTFGMPPQPAGQTSANYGPMEQNYRTPTLDGGIIAPGHLAAPQEDYRRPELKGGGMIGTGQQDLSQCYRRPTLPKGAVAP